MPAEVYSSWWWTLFLALVAAGLIVSMILTKMWRRKSLFALHLSFLLMLSGGAFTAYDSVSGTLRLTPGEPVSVIALKSGSHFDLPFDVNLVKFREEYYPGMSFPRDFISEISINDPAAGSRKLTVSMNKIGRFEGWRFYQTSFDGKGGSVLTVTRDPVGIPLTYSGYLLFFISGLLLLIKPILRRKKPVILIFVGLMSPSSLSATSAPAVPEAMGDSLQLRPVVFNGQVLPFGCMASDFTMKLCGTTHVGGLTPERFVASLSMYPHQWANVPFLYIKNGSLRAALGMSGEYIAPAALYGSDGRYRVIDLYKDGAGPLDKEILKLDEKMALLTDLWNGRLFAQPTPDEMRSVSQTRLKSMLLYSRIRPVRIWFMLLLASGIAYMAFSPFSNTSEILKTSYIPVISKILAVIIPVILSVTGALIFAWLWFNERHIPLSNAPGIMFFVSVALTVISVIYGRENLFLTAAGLLIAGFAALVAWLGFKDPALTPLMPVLASPWLAVHVSVVMVAYALLVFTWPVALIALVSESRRPGMTQLLMRLLPVGVYTLGTGIFLGAVWANLSWGRYWAWDPKETWALVTMLIYALPLHRSLHMRERPGLLMIYILVAILSILMTYAGVNLLPSLHAYQ